VTDPAEPWLFGNVEFGLHAKLKEDVAGSVKTRLGESGTPV
jgi:hypothetical protein